MDILCVAGARPNFVKIAPLMVELSRRPVRARLVHTGQHYDHAMSDSFFEDFQLPKPDVCLGVGSGSHAEQTARVMVEFEKVLLAGKPDVVVVVGDVNSTFACAVTAAKVLVPVAHVEAGLRSFDRTMPEEINRILTDQVSDYLFTPSADGDENLRREGVDPAKIHRVGNIMIDSLRRYEPVARARGVARRLGVEPRGYALVTLHRPSNVDDPAMFDRILGVLETLERDLALVFPVHPRTRKRLAEFGFAPRLEGRGRIVLCEPLGFIDFLSLMTDARIVLTDSGGIQEETTALGVPCLTLRETTERPVTVTMGTNQVVGLDRERILTAAAELLRGPGKQGLLPPLWDGKTAARIADVLVRGARC